MPSHAIIGPRVCCSTAIVIDLVSFLFDELNRPTSHTQGDAIPGFGQTLRLVFCHHFSECDGDTVLCKLSSLVQSFSMLKIWTTIETPVFWQLLVLYKYEESGTS